MQSLAVPRGAAGPGGRARFRLASLTAALFVASIAVGCGGDSAPEPGVGEASAFWSQRDLFEGATLTRGRTLGIEVVREIPRTAWHVSMQERPEGEVLDAAARATLRRSVRLRPPALMQPDAARVRFLSGIADDGLKMRMITLAESPVTGPTRAFGDTPGTQTADLEILEATSGGLVALELVGDPTLMHVESIELVKRLEGGTRVASDLLGTDDRRRAFGLEPGARVEVELAPRGPATLSLFASTLEGDAGSALRVSVAESGDAEAPVDGGWRRIDRRIPGGSGTVTAVLENTGPAGVWISEARLDAADHPAPTVLLITSDTHRGDHLGIIDGSGLVSTPNLDALAERGATFTNCFAPTNVTGPSHMSLMTGLSLRDTRIVNNVTALSHDAQTLAEEFRAAGFKTFGAVSVMHFRPEQSQIDQGFDRFEAPVEGKRDGEVAVQSLVEWLGESDDVPAFAWLHVYDAHTPYAPPTRLVERHYPADRDPRDPERELEIPARALAPWIQALGVTDRDYIDALYAAGVDDVDEILAPLLNLPRVREGICAVTSDHGESLGEDTVWWNHTRLNHSTVHIPLILSGPGIEPARIDRPVELLDVGRTLLDAAGVESDFPGDDLLGAPRGNDPRFSLGAHAWTAAVEADGYFLVMQLQPFTRRVAERNWDHGETQFFDLNRDPRATTDVLADNMDRARKMRAALAAWLNGGTGVGLRADVDLSEAAKQSLQELGYAAGAENAAASRWWTPDPDAPWNQRFED